MALRHRGQSRLSTAIKAFRAIGTSVFLLNEQLAYTGAAALDFITFLEKSIALSAQPRGLGVSCGGPGASCLASRFWAVIIVSQLLAGFKHHDVLECRSKSWRLHKLPFRRTARSPERPHAAVNAVEADRGQHQSLRRGENVSRDDIGCLLFSPLELMSLVLSAAHHAILGV